MTHHAFSLAGHRLHALPSGALHWPDRGLLVVSDLHLGKSERLARRGGSLLPPYETQATLARLDSDIVATAAQAVICLGDSFDDTAASGALEEPDRLRLIRLMAGRDWTWVTGNHDPGPVNLGPLDLAPFDLAPFDLAGSQRAEVRLDSLIFRHIATPDTPEISGHYHPKARLVGQARPCFLIDAHRVILPAYGTYTGGLPCDDPVLLALMTPQAIAVLTGATARAIPMPRGQTRGGQTRGGQIRPRSSSFSR